MAASERAGLEHAGPERAASFVTALFDSISSDALAGEKQGEVLLELFARQVDTRINNSLLRELMDKYVDALTRLRESEERYRGVVTAMNEGVLLLDSSGGVVTANASARRILELSVEQLQGKVPVDSGWKVIREDEGEYPAGAFPFVIACRDGRPVSGAVMGIRKPHGSLTWISVNAQPIFQDDPEHPDAAVVTFTDITERKKWERELHRISVTDPLSGLFNRRKFLEELEREARRCLRSGDPFALAMFDIDRFKLINDTYGHDVGDQVIIAISRIAREQVRESDTLARWGGEEFIVLLPETDAAGARLMAERIRVAIEGNGFETAGTVTASFGVAGGLPGEPPPDLLRVVDQALYAAKHAGRNCVREATREAG